MKVFPIFALIAMFLTVAGCKSASQTEKDATHSIANNSQAVPMIQFEKEVHDFGKIIAGERVSYGFSFTNEGGSPLIITGTRSGCGCTVGDYPKDPLMPGEKARINVVFNSAGRKGFQSESIRVLSNSEESVITLRINAEVLEQ